MFFFWLLRFSFFSLFKSEFFFLLSIETNDALAAWCCRFLSQREKKQQQQQ